MNKAANKTLIDTLKIYSQFKVFMLFFFGIAAGIPFLLVFSTLTWWLNSVGIDKATIGFFGWVGMIYSIKVIWAPVMDTWLSPLLGKKLGKRRGWMLIGQVGIIAGIILMSLIDPSTNITSFALAALFIAFSSATQDIAIDAYRIEAADDEFQGAMSACYVAGYRSGLLIAGGGALFLSEYFSFAQVYQIMAGIMLVGIISTLIVAEPPHAPKTNSGFTGNETFSQQLLDAVTKPFIQFFRTHGYFALLILLFISVYRLSDLTMGVMANPFYQDKGYSASEVAVIIKFYGFFMTIAGSFFGGFWVYKSGIFKPLLAGALLVALTNLIFASLAIADKSQLHLTVVISLDNFSGGLASTAFVAYLSSLVNRTYSATQYAIFGSLMTLPGKFISGFSGIAVTELGYFNFFVYTAALGLPAILLVIYLMQKEQSTIKAESQNN